MSEDNKAVIYTDGGCRPSRGIGGWAFFGYFYIDEKPKQGSGAKGMYPSACGWLDNNSKSDQNPEVTVTRYFESHGSLIPESTNNEAEIYALFKALSFVLDKKITHVSFHIDSKYVLGGIQDWMPKWRSIRFVKPDGTAVANKDLWIKTDDLYQQLLQDGVNITFSWVKGHSGDIGNDIADNLATKAILVGKKGIDYQNIDEIDSKGYFNIDNSTHPFISHNRLVFNDTDPVLVKNGLYQYQLVELGKSVEDSLLGKRMTDTTFSVIYLPEKIEVFEVVRNYYQSLCKTKMGIISVGRLDNILKPSNYKDLLLKNGLFLQQEYPRQDLYDYQLNPMVVEIKPPGLSLRVAEEYALLDLILDSFLLYKQGNCPKTIRFTLMTSELFDYEVIGKKKPKVKLKKHIDSTLKHIDVMVDYYHPSGDNKDKLRLLMGTDLIKRNNLSNLADESTQVYVVTWPESELAYRYATIIEYQGAVGIWCSNYANVKPVLL